MPRPLLLAGMTTALAAGSIGVWMHKTVRTATPYISSTYQSKTSASPLARADIYATLSDETNQAAALNLSNPQSEASMVQIEAALLTQFPDSASLYKYVGSLRAGEWQERVIAAASLGALRQNKPTETISWLMLLPPQKRPAELLELAVSAWASLDAVSAASWVAEQSTVVNQDRLLASVAIGFASRDPSLALKFTRIIFDAGENANQVTAAVFTAWVEKNPTEAAEAIDQLPAEQRIHAQYALLAAWHELDPSGADHWVHSLPNNIERERLLSQLSALNALKSVMPIPLENTNSTLNPS